MVASAECNVERSVLSGCGLGCLPWWMLKSQKSLDKLKATSFLLDPNRNLVEANLAAATRVTCAHLNGVLHVHVATLRVCGGHWHAARGKLDYFVAWSAWKAIKTLAKGNSLGLWKWKWWKWKWMQKAELQASGMQPQINFSGSACWHQNPIKFYKPCNCFRKRDWARTWQVQAQPLHARGRS